MDRRRFLKSCLTAATAVTWTTRAGARNWLHAAASVNGPLQQDAVPVNRPARIRFAAIGLNHGHIYSQIDTAVRGGGRFVSFFAPEPDLADALVKRFPTAARARSAREILADSSIQLVVSASIPNERAPLGIEVMRHGKDFMVDKPGATTLEQLAEVRRVQAETGRIYSVLIERHESKSITKAGELVKAGAIGEVLQTVGLAPHRMSPATRPAWFFERERYGGVLCDLASHNLVAVLFFTGSTRASVVASQVGNLRHAQYPGLEDFGDVMLRGDRGSGYIRVDWFTPDALPAFGDGRLTILGSDGYIELRKNADIGGRAGGNHLFLVDHKQVRRVECDDVVLPYADRLVDDVLNRTETATPQARTFLAMELALEAERAAQRIARPSA
jgi:predicted dehydrogenase